MNTTRKGQTIRLDLKIISSSNKADIDSVCIGKLLQAQVLDEAKTLRKLPNDYSGAWKMLLKWRGVSQAELHRRTHISENAISSIIMGNSKGTVDTVVLMCLAANLPWEMSMYLIERSGHNLQLNNEDHIWYRFALKYLYSMTLDEIRAFFFDKGIPTYNKFSLSD